jgi:hypothetical protein
LIRNLFAMPLIVSRFWRMAACTILSMYCRSFPGNRRASFENRSGQMVNRWYMFVSLNLVENRDITTNHEFESISDTKHPFPNDGEYGCYFCSEKERRTIKIITDRLRIHIVLYIWKITGCLTRNDRRSLDMCGAVLILRAKSKELHRYSH